MYYLKDVGYKAIVVGWNLKVDCNNLFEKHRKTIYNKCMNLENRTLS